MPHLVCDLMVEVVRVGALSDQPLEHLIAGLGVLALLTRTAQPADTCKRGVHAVIL
jgi:hypothetical protein